MFESRAPAVIKAIIERGRWGPQSRSSPMRVSSTNAIRCISALLTGLLGSRVLRCRRGLGAGRTQAADPDPVFLRSSDRCRRFSRPAGLGRRPVQRRGPRGDDQHRQRFAGRDRARRLRRQRFRAGRHQRTDPLSRQVRCAARQGGVRAVQPVALRHHRAQEPRHPRARPISRARRSASPRAICRSGCGRRWRGRTASRSRASSRAGSAPPCASRCCRRVRSTP